MKLINNKKVLIIALVTLFFIMIFNVKAYAEEATPEPFKLSDETVDVELNGREYLSYSGGVAGEKVTWESSDETIATVENGTVTGLQIGTTTITATRGTETAECEVNVIYYDITIGGNDDDSVVNVNLILNEHETEQLYATVEDYNMAEISGAKVEWESSDPEVVTVNKDTGLIEGIKAGKATITAKAVGVSDTVEVNVYNGPEFTDFSKATYESNLDYNTETLKISGIEPKEEDDYYYIVTPNNSKPELILSRLGSIDIEAMNDTIDYFLINKQEKYMYTRKLAKYTELKQDLYLWVIQEVNLEAPYANEDGNSIYSTVKFVVEGKKLERAELPQLNLILQSFNIGYWSNENTEEDGNYSYILFNFPSAQKNRKFTLKIGKVTDINILTKIKNNDYTGITELLNYAKTNNYIYNQTLTTTDEAYYRSNEALFDGNSLLEDDAYYYIYAQFDDENGKYNPIEGVTLGQAWKSEIDTDWDLWAYTEDDFNWDNLTPSYTPSEPESSNPTPSEPEPEEDTTKAPTKLPHAGNKTAIAILAIVIMVSVILYKIYNKFNDIK